MAGRQGGERDEAEVRRFVERVAMVFADWGFPRMAARVLMTVMVADEPSLTATEIGDRLGVSPAAISGAVRYLTQINMLIREPVPGSRRDQYRVDDAWYAVSTTKSSFFSTVADLAGGGVTALGGAGTPAGARIAEMRDYFVFIQAEMGTLLDKWAATRPAREDGA